MSPVEIDEATKTIEEIYRRVQACRDALPVPAVVRALELAAIHLHDALWVLGADVGLNPDFDRPSDPVDGGAR